MERKAKSNTAGQKAEAAIKPERKAIYMSVGKRALRLFLIMLTERKEERHSYKSKLGRNGSHCQCYKGKKAKRSVCGTRHKDSRQGIHCKNKYNLAARSTG